MTGEEFLLILFQNSLSSASSSKKKNKNHLLEPERMKELETVEAQVNGKTIADSLIIVREYELAKIL